MSTLTGSDGTFVFCPLPMGTYDVVIVGSRTSDGALYQPSIVAGVAVGSTTGTVNLHLPTDTTTSSASLTGIVTSQNSTTSGTVAVVQLSVLETVNSTVYTIPLPLPSTQSSASLLLETAPSTSSPSCPTGTDCASYTMQLSSGGPYYGAWSSSGATLTQSSLQASYFVDGMAFVPLSGGADCSLPEIKSSAITLGTAGPYSVTVPTLGFTGCQ